MKRKAGDIFPSLTLTTSQGKPLTVPPPGACFTHVQFRRWTGCPICNTHIGSLRRNADRIASAGIQEVLFFHSSQEDVKSFHQDLPFDAVADPGKRYYRLLGVEQSRACAMHPRALWAGFRGMGSRFNLAMTGRPDWTARRVSHRGRRTNQSCQVWPPRLRPVVSRGGVGTGITSFASRNDGTKSLVPIVFK